MLNLGTVQQGSTIYIPIPTRDATGAAVTGNTLADGDFSFHKDGSTTAATIDAAATTPSTDFATTTGRNQLAVDLSADADFTADSFWQVWLSKSIDSTTIEECIAVFTIESDAEKYARIFSDSLVLGTTIATLTSQTSFTLTDGSADNDAYNGCPIVIRDASTLEQRAVGIVSDYVGASKTVTLESDPGIFTMASGDYVAIQILPAGLTAQQKTDIGTQVDASLGAATVDSNVVQINGTTITGDGSSTPFGV